MGARDSFGTLGTPLPRELDAFVGRATELDDLARLIETSPLVTVAGPGGAGKTRLALRLARQVAHPPSFVDDVVLVELAPLAEPRLVLHALAASIGVAESSDQPLLAVVTRALRAQRALLVLDNCEHVIAACAELAHALLRDCPSICVLATSREPLHIAGETVYRIPSLHVPRDDRLESLAGAESAQLFVLRARAANASFVLDDSNAAAVAEICRGLDGLPLAIELAAARVAAFSPDDIARLLDDALRLASAGPRSAATRHQTLAATLDWSYALLDAPERQLFARLAVFAGGFTLEGAQAVVPERVDALEVLARLVAKSMVQAEQQPDGAMRYRLLEPLRQFADARLVDSGALAAARQQHAEYILALAERISGNADRGAFFSRWFELSPESDNIRVALDWAFATANTDLAVRLGATLWMWWSRPDRQAQGRLWLERIAELPDVEQHPLGRGQLVVAAAHLAMLQGDMAVAVDFATRAKKTALAGGNRALASVAGCVLGTALAYIGETDAAESVLRESADHARASHVRWIEVLSTGTLGHIALGRGDLAAAEADIRESLRLARDGIDPWSQAMALTSLGDLLRAQGRDAQAGPAYDEALAQFEALDPHRKYAPQGLVHNLGYVALARGEIQRAARLFLESADIYRAVGGDRRGVVECVVGLGCTAVRAGNPPLAARLFGTVESELARLGTRLTTANRSEYERGLTALAEALPAGQLASARADGAARGLDDALDLARPLALDPEHAQRIALGRGASLTPREHEVAVLVARGLSNKQIADVLVITEKTAKNHVQRVLDKVGMHSRAALAARADDLGLRD